MPDSTKWIKAPMGSAEVATVSIEHCDPYACSTTLLAVVSFGMTASGYGIDATYSSESRPERASQIQVPVSGRATRHGSPGAKEPGDGKAFGRRSSHRARAIQAPNLATGQSSQKRTSSSPSSVRSCTGEGFKE